MNELNEIEDIKMSKINIIDMKSIKPITKERLNEQAERIRRFSDSRFAGCKTLEELEELSEKLFNETNQDDDDAVFALIQQMEEWKKFHIKY